MNELKPWFLRILDPFNNVIASGLTVSSSYVQDIIFVQTQHNKGKAEIKLWDTRDPVARWQREIYKKLDYEQRVEVYDDESLLAAPIWAGVITGIPADIQQPVIQCEGVLRRLDTQRLYRNQTLNGNAATLFQYCLNTFSPVFNDNFDSGAFPPNWSFTGTGAQWSFSTDPTGVLAGKTVTAGHLVAGGRLQTANTYTAAQWQNARISWDFYPSSYGAYGAIGLGNSWNSNFIMDTGGNQLEITLIQAHDGPSAVDAFLQTTNLTSFATLTTRNVLMPAAQWYHFEVWTLPNNTISILINNIEMIVETQYTFSNNPTRFQFSDNFSTGSQPWYIDNFAFDTYAYAIQPGTIPATTTLINNQQFQNDSRLKAIEWLSEYSGRTFRVNYGRNNGGDTIDWNLTVGTDKSASIMLVEGDVNLPGPGVTLMPFTKFKRDASSIALATLLTTFGQGSSDNLSNFQVRNQTAVSKYNYVEDDYNDNRIVTPAIGRVLAYNRLALTSAGLYGYSGSVIDPDRLLTPGDTVAIRSESYNLDTKFPIVGITRHNDTTEVDLVLNYFPWSDYKSVKSFDDMLELLRRSWYQQLNTVLNTFSYTTNVLQSFMVDSRPNKVTSVLIDVQIVSGAPTWNILIDGLGITPYFTGGSTSVTNSQSWIDTGVQYPTYPTLVTPGPHTLGITCVSGAPAIISVSLQFKGLNG